MPDKKVVDVNSVYALELVKVAEDYGATLVKDDGAWKTYKHPLENDGKLRINTEHNYFKHWKASADGAQGGVINLVHFLKGDADSFIKPSDEEKRELYREIADKYGCRVNPEDLYKKQLFISEANEGEGPATSFRFRPDAKRGSKLKAVKPTPATLESIKITFNYFKALGFASTNDITFALHKGETGSSYCFCPSAPTWADHADNEDVRNKGWGKASAREAIAKHGADLYVLDFDGIKGESGEVLYPYIWTLKAIIKHLSPYAQARVLELTSISTDGVTSKAHITFKAKTKVYNCDDYEKNYSLLVEMVEAYIKKTWKSKPNEASRLALDKTMGQPGHLKRVAGTRKEGKKNAIILHYVNEEGLVDFEYLFKTREVEYTSGSRRAIMGEDCKVYIKGKKKATKKSDEITFEDDPEDIEVINLGSDIYLASAGILTPEDHNEESARRGGMVLRCYYKPTRHNTLKTFDWVVGSSVSKQKMEEEIYNLTQLGVKTPSGSEANKQLAICLDDYAKREDIKEFTVISKHGWSRLDDNFPTYTMGNSTIITNSKNLLSDCSAKDGDVKGDLEAWKKAVNTYATTPLFRFGLGFAIAPLLYRFFDGVDVSGGLHYFGNSSSGKSTLLKVAASMAGNPKKNIRQWNTTTNGMEPELANATDSILSLDELKDARRESVAQIIMKIGNQVGKVRMSKSADGVRDGFSWSNVGVLSSGENSIKTYLAELYQGGEGVRLVDIPVKHNHDITLNSAEAESLLDAISSNYGHVYRVVAQYLINISREELRATISQPFRSYRDNLKATKFQSAEGQRISLYFAAAQVGLDLLAKLGILDITKEDISSVVNEVCDRVLCERSDSNDPNERALNTLRLLVDTSPYLFPKFGDKEPNNEILGWRVEKGMIPKTNMLYGADIIIKNSSLTQASMKSSSNKQGYLALNGTDAKRFMEFLKEKDLLLNVNGSSTTILGQKGKFMGIKLHEEYLTEEEVESSDMLNELSDSLDDNDGEFIRFSNLKH